MPPPRSQSLETFTAKKGFKDDDESEEDEEDEIVKIRNRKSKKTLNQILDKIYDKGIDSIDEDEKQILKEISNK